MYVCMSGILGSRNPHRYAVLKIFAMGSRMSKTSTVPEFIDETQTKKKQGRSCCLTTREIKISDPVPLQSVSVDVRIEGFIANVQSTLVYKNKKKNPIEVRYEFPMDDQSAVYHFEAQVEDRVIIAECQEKQQAKQTYDDAVNRGYGAVLLQEDDFSSDIFSCLVGNLPPDAKAIIKFGYVTELSLQPDGTLSFLLPTLLNPRYNPFPESGGSTRPPDITYGQKGGKQPYKFEIKATIQNPGKIVSVKSPKDKLDVKLTNDNTLARVTLAKPFVADHDLTLDITFQEMTKPYIIIEEGDGSKDGILKKDIVMLNFFPQLKDSDYSSKHEFIFVVDRSGSMMGSRMEMAKETLLLFLKSLPSGCYFNIVGFGTTFQVLFPDGSQEYSEDSLKKACEHQNGMKADLGRTEILQPLKHIYEKSTIATHSREILLLTDGEVMNTQAVIDLVKKNAHNTRVFSFGIGEGASTALVKGIARAGRGRAEFTKEGERLQPLVVKTLKEATQSAVTNLHLDWQLVESSCEMIQLPKELPPLFAGERLIIYAMTFSEKAIVHGIVQLKGNIGEHNLKFGIDVDSAKNISSKDETLPIHRLAAKAQIKHLQDAGKDENKDSIVLLSTVANVISCHTSMVGVDKNRKEKVMGDLFRRNDPMMYDSTLQMNCYSAVKMDSKSSRPLSISRSGRYKTRSKMLSYYMDREDDCYESQVYCNLSSRSQRFRTSQANYYSAPIDALEGGLQPKLPAEPTYMDIVRLQTFSGEWKLTAEFAQALGTTLEPLQNATPVKGLNVWATVLALSYLVAKFSDKRDEWEMVEMKARQWFDLQNLEGMTVDELLQKARNVIG